jgi:geranylgeranyl diphosphate synthase, type II
MNAASPIAALLEERRLVVDEALDRALSPGGAWPPTIHRAVRYSLFAGGKRIRPILVLLAGEAVGGERQDLLPFSCAVEMVHTYSLVHDDLPAMDNDDLRRGKPTSHKVFGEAIAILAGDALLTRAFHLLAEVPDGWNDVKLRRRITATALLGQACGTAGLIGGQVADLESEGKNVEPRDLARLHQAKTGALLAACVRGGGILGGAGAEELERLGRYGDAVGLAFQVVDDILDVTEEAAQLGKTAGKDVAARKATFVSLHGLDGARAAADALLEEALAALAPLGPRGETLAALAWHIVTRHA